MKSITINGSKRESVGKKSTKALRNAGQVPCVLYGIEGNPLHFAAEEIAFNDLVYTPDVHTVKIKLKTGESYDAILQDIQFHPVTDAIQHMDFYQIFDDKPITMEIPIHTEGVARGVKNGGVLRYNLRRLKVRGLPGDLPDYIQILFQVTFQITFQIAFQILFQIIIQLAFHLILQIAFQIIFQTIIQIIRKTP